MNKPSGLITFLFTDIEGSTKLAQEYHDTIQNVLKTHHDILLEIIESNNGFVFKIIGDAFCCSFQNSIDAVRAAVEAQLKLNSEDWKGVEIKVRMGIHSGNAEWSGTDYMGYITLARTSRVMSAAYGEQILISNDAYELCIPRQGLGNENMMGEITFRDLGERRLKDVIQPIRLYQILSKGLREDFPPLKTLDARPNNLPIQLTSFIGRENVMQQIKNYLKNSQLITLLGTGGAGKTRTALQVGADMIDEFENGVYITELAHISDPVMIAKTVMDSLGLKEEPGRSLEETIISYLKNKELLLILDNCEHLIQKSTNISILLLSNCPKLKIIATSREALNCFGEQIFRVPSLSLPDISEIKTPENLTQYEAVRLFIERALVVNPNFRVTNENMPSLAAICSRLDGIPLAIELASARTKMLSLEKIHERLKDVFNLLNSGKRTALPRQQTLKALIDWSYDLLSEKEKLLWSRLTVFSGGWTLESAEEICSDEKINANEILDLLGQLTEKSIINYNELNERYNILETMKQYAKSKLAESEDSPGLVSKHLVYFSSLAKAAKLSGKDSQEWLLRFDLEKNNFIAAIESSLNGGDKEISAQLTDNLRLFWEIRGHYTTGLRLLQMLIENPDGISKKTLAKLHLNIGTLTRAIGDYECSRKYAKKSLEILKKVGDSDDVIVALQSLGNVEALFGNFDEAENIFEECLALSRKSNFISGIAFALNNLGNVTMIKGNYERAELLLKESLEFHYKSGDRRNVCFALDSMGNLMKEKGNNEEAKNYLMESLEISREIGDKSGVAFALYNLGSVFYSEGNIEQAGKYTEESLKLRIEIGDKPGIAYALSNLGKILFEQKNYEEAYKYLEESLRIRLESGDRHAILFSLISYLPVIVFKGGLELAVKILGAIDNGIKTLGLATDNEESIQREQLSEILLEKLGEEKYLKYFEEGKKITMEESAELILNDKL